MRPCADEPVCGYAVISIHAPRVGCDYGRNRPKGGHQDFNPRTPGGVRLYAADYSRHARRGFQSTHPGWGATQFHQTNPTDNSSISIHAPRVGCDKINVPPKSKEPKFQSTHPGWGATFRRPVRPALPHISIHAPRVGCDRRIVKRCIHSRDFNPRTPGGVRLQQSMIMPMILVFQSTHPGWGATEKTGGGRR